MRHITPLHRGVSAPCDATPAHVPLALYVHFPWCVKKCPYCDFNSHTAPGTIDQSGYLEALLKDLQYDLSLYGHARKLSSIFLGGGTPSLFRGAAIAHLLDEIQAISAFDDDIEITLEANPGALEHDDFAAYRAAGVNRLSLGVQSFSDEHLQKLGRVHNAQQARHAINAALDSGFTNINVDLMYGLPQQTVDSARRDLEIALEFSPTHLSMYQLTIEPNTWFHRYPPRLPNEQEIVTMQSALQALAGQHGYQQYEVSAYAKPGMRCRHNLNYWKFGDYLGIGAGAHGKITENGSIKRYWKQKHPQRYLQCAGQAMGVGEIKEIAASDVLFEFLLNSLRLTHGFDVRLIQARTGRTVAELFTVLGEVMARRLVVAEANRIKCSAMGYRFLDDVLQDLLP